MSPRFAWRLLPVDPVRAGELAERAGVSPVIAQLLLHRGVCDASQASRFFAPTLESLEDPLALPDMGAAVARIRKAIAAGEPILVFGDSDVDGITASAIVHELLQRLGARVETRLSNRLDDGYGFPPALVEWVTASPVGLVILLDCGTNQAAEIRQLAARGVDTVVIDHHVPTANRSSPLALVNPRLVEDATAFCTAGLAIKLVQALCPGDGEALSAALDLAALGTLADYVPLVRENRVLVAAGLSRIPEARPGLATICRDVEVTKASPEQILKRVVPRLNAPGRLGEPTPVWKCLLERSAERAGQWAGVLAQRHAHIKHLHKQVVSEAHEQAGRMHFKDQFVTIVGRRGWPQGLMGPVAAQLVDRFNRPAIAIALDGEVGVGSGRSLAPFNLFEALKACEGMLLRYGGHPQACGLTITTGNVERLRDGINRHAQHAWSRRHMAQALDIETSVAVGELTQAVCETIETFAPFGAGNPKPLLLVRGVRIEAGSDGVRWVEHEGVRLRLRERLPELSTALRCDLVVTTTITAGQATLSVRDWCESGPVSRAQSAAHADQPALRQPW